MFNKDLEVKLEFGDVMRRKLFESSDFVFFFVVRDLLMMKLNYKVIGINRNIF